MVMDNAVLSCSIISPEMKRPESHNVLFYFQHILLSCLIIISFIYIYLYCNVLSKLIKAS